jgi:polysaccharide biosynthesis protein PslH
LKILYVCHRFPFPPRGGGKIRPFNMIRPLSGSGHQVTVASLARSAQEAEDGRGITAHCAHYEAAEVRELAQRARMIARTPTPSSMGYFYSPVLQWRIRGVFVHCSSAAQYVAGVRGIPKILDFGDMDSQKWLEYAHYKPFPLSTGYWLEGKKVERAERRLARRFDMCTTTSRAEWETLERYGTGTPTAWFPNGVDSDYFSPGEEPYDPDAISFVGRMDYYPNEQCMLDFCTNVFPRLRQRRPNLAAVDRRSGSRAQREKTRRAPGVTVTGSVPDVRPYVRRSAAMVAPLNIARGTQNKILEARAMGVPVVTSPAAVGGVDAVRPEHFLVAGDHAEQYAALLCILEDAQERRRLALAGRARVLSHHAWPASMRRLDNIIERTVASCIASLHGAQPANA